MGAMFSIGVRWRRVSTLAIVCMSIASYMSATRDALAQIPPPPVAPAFRLSYGPSFIDVDPFARATVYNWYHAGNDQLHELSNWFRVGPSGGERSVHTLNVIPGVPQDMAADPAPDFVTVQYIDTAPVPRFRLEIDYYLSGHLLGEEIRIFNIHPNLPLEMHFFEHVDLDLSNTAPDDRGMFTGPNSVEQTDDIVLVRGTYDSDHRELDAFDGFNDFIPRLTNGSATTLLDTPGDFAQLGPGDLSWTLQWDFTGLPGDRPIIMPGDMTTIIKHWECFVVVPEPACGIPLALACAALLTKRRRPIAK
jgi:hypothetical protein